LETGETSALTRRNLVRGLASGSLVLFAAGCETNALTGRNQLVFVDDAQLAQLSLSAWEQTKKETPITTNAAASARVRNVGQKIQKAAGYGGQTWEFATFESKEANAFVLPGGKVGVYRGLLDIASTDDQLGAVLGHETGHVSGRHAAERYSQSMLAETGMSAAGVALNNSNLQYKQALYSVLGLGVQVGVLLPYSRLQESEADRIGVDYMHAAGYKPNEAVTLWEKMAKAGGARQPEFLSTHPAPETRIEDIRKYIAAKGYA
jgi:predicted Zn-dependent protease